MNYSKLFRYTILSIIVLLSACKSDEEVSDNIISFDGGKIKLYKGYQFKYSSTIPETGSTPFVVILLGNGVNFDQNSGPSGIGSLIKFYMYSESEYEIKQGDYTIDIFSTKPTFSADLCEIYYKYDFAQDTGTVYDINAGTFNVENLGSVMRYEISVVADTILFSGTYRGPIHTIN